MRRNLLLFAGLCLAGSAAAQQVAEPVLPVVVAPSELRSKPRLIKGESLDNALPEFLPLTKAGRYGVVAARAIITAEGKLQDIRMDPSSGDATIDAAIIRALGGWQLSAPIDKSGAKVATSGRFPVTIGHYPKRIAGTSPVMPQAAKDAFHNGKVTVSYSIDAAGLPTDAKVTRSSKSDLIDGVVLAAIAAYRFEKPLGLDGKPITLPAAAKHHFSQGDGEGSYIQSLKTLPCRTVVGETDWWIAAHPGEKPINMDFYAFMAGLSFIAPQALGWGSPDIMTINARHTKAWNRALEACRAKPNSTFLSEYRKG